MTRAPSSTRATFVWASIAMLSLFAGASSTIGGQASEAKITQIVNAVQLHIGQQAPHFAALNDKVPNDSSVQTASNSRVEISFDEGTLTRLSANTVCHFKKGMRDLELSDGAVLLQSRRGAGAAKVSIAGNTAAITGTAIVEFHPHAYLKFIALEETGRLYSKRRWGESVLISPGQMVITNPDASRLADPIDVDLQRLLRTSLLITEFPPLGSKDLIAKESERQQRAKSKKHLVDTNLVIFGKGTVVSLTNPALVNAAVPAAEASAASESDTIPSSNDIGTVEMQPKPLPSESGMPATKPVTDAPH